jgi:hypothetical protein
MKGVARIKILYHHASLLCIISDTFTNPSGYSAIGKGSASHLEDTLSFLETLGIFSVFKHQHTINNNKNIQK